ncbi:glycosyltransferase [candidate division KSB1 bacterium]|nr:glycosyltransferase [candidate division KSB1 bacterium]
MSIPEISVIIPTHNRADSLINVLSNLEAQTCPFDVFQVIVIDDASTDDTFSLLSQFRHHSQLNIRILQCKLANAGAARNLGVSQAVAPLLIFLDADIYVHPDFISKHLAYHQAYPQENMILQGRVEMAKELLVPHQVRHGIWNPPLGRKERFDTQWQSFRAANTSIKRQLFIRVGGFNPQLCAAEDTELGYRLWKAGANFVFDNSILTTHYHPMTWGQYLDKAKKYGKSIALWYAHEPEVQRELVNRYGLCVQGCRIRRKLKYSALKLVLNDQTTPAILVLAEKLSRFRHSLTLMIYKLIFNYQLVQAFKRMLSMSTMDDRKRVAKGLQ